MTNTPLVKRIDTLTMKVLSVVLLLLAVGLLLWAAFVVIVQCAGWLRSGGWQGVSVGLLFVSEEAQSLIQASGLSPNAVALVPSWGSAVSIEDVAARGAGHMVGVQMIYSWLLSTPLVVWVVFAALVLLPLSALVERTTILIHED